MYIQMVASNNYRAGENHRYGRRVAVAQQVLERVIKVVGTLAGATGDYHREKREYHQPPTLTNEPHISILN
jgi:hypothetical protein